MLHRIFSTTFALAVKLVLLALVAALLLYRTDFLSAQEGATEDSPVLLPRTAEIEEEADDEDDADGDGADPPTDNDGYDSPPGEADGLIVYTIRPGDTLWRLAARLGIPYAVLREQTESPSLIHPGQQFTYRDADRIDSSIPPTDDDGTDSDGYDTPPPSTDFDGISTPLFIDNDGLYSDATDNDGIDTTGNLTDNDGTDSDGIDTTGNLTDNDGTDSDGIDTTGNLSDNNDSDNDDSDDSDDSDDDSD